MSYRRSTFADHRYKYVDSYQYTRGYEYADQHVYTSYRQYKYVDYYHYEEEEPYQDQHSLFFPRAVEEDYRRAERRRKAEEEHEAFYKRLQAAKERRKATEEYKAAKERLKAETEDQQQQNYVITKLERLRDQIIEWKKESEEALYQKGNSIEAETPSLQPEDIDITQMEVLSKAPIEPILGIDMVISTPVPQPALLDTAVTYVSKDSDLIVIQDQDSLSKDQVVQVIQVQEAPSQIVANKDQPNPTLEPPHLKVAFSKVELHEYLVCWKGLPNVLQDMANHSCQGFFFWYLTRWQGFPD